VAIVFGSALLARAGAAEVVQFPVDGVLDGRPVSTLTGGVLVPWTTGIDKDDAYMTLAAAMSLHQTGPALPDDGRFAANADHPAVVLHFANAAPAASPQAHLQTAMGSFVVPAPRATYEKIFLFLTASYGDAPLAIELRYADGTTTATTFTLPDWGTGKALPAGPPTFFNLIAGLHKWNKAGASLDTPSHTITGVVVVPAAGRILTAISVDKTTAAPWLTFWGATGIATAVPDAGSDAAPDVASDAVAEASADVVADVAVERADDMTVEEPPDAAAPEAPAAGGQGGRGAAGATGGASAPGLREPSSSGCSLAGRRDDASFAAALLALAAVACRARRRG
jgi:hypothetical protein